MAEGLLRSRAGDRCEACSAGTDPQGLHPLAVAAMREIGIDITRQRSEHVETYVGTRVDTVITVCDHAAATCPRFPGAVPQVHWSLNDPAGIEGSPEERLVEFRRVRDEIAERLDGWLAEFRGAA